MKTVRHAATGGNYLNRDLSWMRFNRRVLEEAEQDATPLLERLKFLSIVSTNLDEFMSVRVAGMIEQTHEGKCAKDFTGYTPQGLLARIKNRAAKLVSEQYAAYESVCAKLAAQGVRITKAERLQEAQQEEIERYYRTHIHPVLTPMAFDRSRPFPFVRSHCLNAALVLRPDGKGKSRLALLQIPPGLPRYIAVTPCDKMCKYEFVLIEDVIKARVSSLFKGYKPSSVTLFRLIRNADLPADDVQDEDLLKDMERKLQRRKRGEPVRLEIESGFQRDVCRFLLEKLQEPPYVQVIEGPIDLSFLMSLSGALKGFEHLSFPRTEPRYPLEFAGSDDPFEAVRASDIALFHPFDSFEPVVSFIAHSAADPSVVAIKMTLYRVSGQSRIVRALAQAAESGKQVTVVVELQARFDEERNIRWAKHLEQAGCHVVYGLPGLKVHAKMALVVRREADGLRSYAHVSTGNYNDKTANVYTDIGLFTSREQVVSEIAGLFNGITGLSVPSDDMQALYVAPHAMRRELTNMICREKEHALAGKNARIIVKINALSDRYMIDQLYDASRAGVKIDLIVRGICCLRPGVPGLSESITVRSIVDRYLEHSRLYYFENGGEEQVWIASADWMTRNLSRRIELMCPLLDERLRRLAADYLLLLLDDTEKARLLRPDGKYVSLRTANVSTRSQFAVPQLLRVKYDKEREAAEPNIPGGYPFFTDSSESPFVYH